MDRHELRKEHTREAIRYALVDLLQTRDYNDITVREIAEQAGIGFKTFYRHYDDKDDLTEALYSDLWWKFLDQITLATPEPVENMTNIRHLLTASQENVTVIRAILSIRSHTNLVPEFIRVVTRSQVQQFHPEIFSSDDDVSQKLLDAMTARFISGQMDMVKWWVENDFSLPIETMTALIFELVIKPILVLDIAKFLQEDQP